MQNKPKSAQHMSASERIEEISKIIAFTIISSEKGTVCIEKKIRIATNRQENGINAP